MNEHSSNPSEKSNADEALQARLAEIEAGFLDPYAFTSQTLIQATFPHSARAGKEIVLVNGGVEVSMYSPRGLPYGIYPRLIMCWLTREALRRKDMPLDEARTIPLGSSLADFMRDLGMRNFSGGKSGNISRLRDQMAALFSTFISVQTTGRSDIEDMPRSFRQIENTIIADSSMLWWDPKAPEQMTLQDSVVTLSKSFYLDLVGSAVPLDNAILREIKSSPVAIDLYCWLTYRLSYHRGLTVVTWDQLRGQFGGSYVDTAQGKRNFKKRLLVALDKVLAAWPEATVSATEYGLMLRPGEPSVPKKIQESIREHLDGDQPKF